MGSSILNFLLLMLRIPLNLNLDASHKSSNFTKALLEKSLEFVLNKRNNTVIFNFGLVLLPAGVNLIQKKQGHKKEVLRACSIGCVKIVFALLTKIVTLYMKTIIV